MKTLRECIQEAEEKKVAIGHFNISNLEMFWGVWYAAKEHNDPVIIGLSEGERAFVGVRQAKALVESLREEYEYPIFLNADHSYSFEHFKEAIDARYDAAIFDGAKLSTEENISETKKCVLYARSVDPEIIVEGELGYIGMSSKLLDAVPDGVSPETMTTPEGAKRFVEETGVDLFAPSVGTIHGMLRDIPNPRLDIKRIKEIRKSSGVPLVLHGGSGTSDEDFKSAIDAGISIIHVSTEMRIGFKDAIRRVFVEQPDELAPYRIMKLVVEEIQKIVSKNLAIFNNR